MTNLAIKLGLFGSALGLLAGFIELTIGTQIRPWIGNKENPVVLGLVTLLLSAFALGAMILARNLEPPTNDGKLAIFLGVLFPAAICFTTVGRLWYLPGSLLIATGLLLAHQYWFDISLTGTQETLPSLSWASRSSAVIGGLIVLATVGLGFWKSQISLFQSEVYLESEQIHYDILPMDFVRRTYWPGSTSMVEEFEVTQVMIIYILLLTGAAFAIIAGLAASRLFTGFGGLVIFIGLALFIVWLPGILAQAQYVSNDYFSVIRSLGWGWWISLFGMSLVLIASLLKLHPDLHR